MNMEGAVSRMQAKGDRREDKMQTLSEHSVGRT